MNTRPQHITADFIKICWQHSKETLVSAEDYDRLMDFAYLESVKKLDAYTSFVYGLDIPQITNWWKHKEINDYMIPCLIKLQSRLSAEVWDSTPSTTNTNEVQHHWTNSVTSIKLTPVEALESQRTVDQNIADQIKMSLETSILLNPNNKISLV
ncbi:hypothetical protein B0H17DRAFT_1209095 [Mycena rosella]|uniref:Uncharacterized protein n=1 Tax=Mycena rosella TaxID=1033263 RepID=A0AAD7D311_MYCRO|nr:hypothetical protein B0H17DRAFT_1209095 [Mycena rosella]